MSHAEQWNSTFGTVKYLATISQGSDFPKYV